MPHQPNMKGQDLHSHIQMSHCHMLKMDGEERQTASQGRMNGAVQREEKIITVLI